MNVRAVQQKAAIYTLGGIIACLTVIRFVGLGTSPPGFHFDEAIISAEAICLSETGRNSFGEIAFFTPSGGGGYASPTHLYPKALWIKAAGTSIAAMRAYAALEASIMAAGLFLLARLHHGTMGGMYSLLAASVSPWIFQFSRLAVDDPMGCDLGVIWGVYFFLRSSRLRDAAFSAAFFSIAVYSYSSARVVLPLLFPFMVWARSRAAAEKGGGRYFFTFFSVGVILCFPLVRGAVAGTLLSRYEAVGILTDSYRAQIGATTAAGIATVFVRNVMLHLSPRYLFVDGDPNLRHSTHCVGELSWVDDLAIVLAVALLIVIWREQRRIGVDAYLVLCLVGAFVGIFPAALTWEGLPHSLRSACCWPFVALLTGYILHRASRRWSSLEGWVAAVAFGFACFFLRYFFFVYPERAGGWFDVALKNAASEAQDTHDWKAFERLARSYPPLVARYYLVHYEGLSFRESAGMFQAVKERHSP